MRSEPFTIRGATVRDVPAIVAIWDELMRFHEARDPLFARGPGAQAKFADFLRANLARAEACVLVAERGGEVAGYCMAAEFERPPVFSVQRIAEIFDIAVKEECRRSGAGGSLVGGIRDWARSRGAAAIELHAAVRNEVAGAFWDKVGARPYLEVRWLPV